MYYKIENQDCELYKKLKEFREREIRIRTENKKAVAKKIPYKWGQFRGCSGQQNVGRTTAYRGFCFENPEEVDKNVWRCEEKEGKLCFYPNKKTKKGKEMDSFLNNLKRSSVFRLWDILGIDPIGKCSFPYLEIVNDVLVLYLDDKQEPSDQNLIEITKKEFEAILNQRKK